MTKPKIVFDYLMKKLDNEEEFSPEEYQELISYMPFCVRLKRLREKNELTIEDACYMLNISSELYNLWEDGLKLPTLPQLICLANLFGVSLEYLEGNNSDFVERNQDKLKDHMN